MVAVTSASFNFPLAVLRMAPSGALQWLGVAVAAVAVLAIAYFSYRRTLPELTRPQRWTLQTLRSVALLLLLFMLLEPVLHRRDEKVIPPGVLVLTDGSRSMRLRNEEGQSRLEAAHRLEQAATEGLRRRNGRPRIFFARGARRVWPENGEGEDDGTNLEALLLSGAQRHLADNLQAILLLSDGVDTDRDRPSIAGLRVPVYTVAVGDSSSSGDLRVDRVRYPTLAYRGERIEIDAEAVIDASEAGRTWALLEGGGKTDSLLVQWPAGGGRVPLRFTVRADSLGMLRRSLRLVPLPQEALVENNRMEVALQVRKQRLHLVLIGARPGWDFHFLFRRFARDKRFLMEAVYLRRDQWILAGTDSLWTPPADLAHARGVDAWILASLDDLDRIAASAPGIEASVRRGAGLLTLFSKPRRKRPPVLSAGARALLPVVLQPGARWVEGEHRVEVTAAGMAHPILDLPAEVGSAPSRLEAMPPLWEAVHGVSVKQDSDLLLQLRGDDGVLPLLAVGRHGKGVVASWSAAPLWSWSFWRLGERENEDVYFALTGNLLFYLAEGGHRTRLRLVLPRPVVAVGEDALVRAVVLDSRMQPDRHHDLWLEWRADDGTPVDSTAQATGRRLMKVDASTEGGRSLRLPALPPGPYHFRIALEEKGGRIVSPWKSLEIDPYSVEYRHPQPDPVALGEIARMTGGRRLAEDELAEWAARLTLQETTRVEPRRIPVWASLGLFAVLIGLLSAEWALRRRWGMV